MWQQIDDDIFNALEQDLSVQLCAQLGFSLSWDHGIQRLVMAKLNDYSTPDDSFYVVLLLRSTLVGNFFIVLINLLFIHFR